MTRKLASLIAVTLALSALAYAQENPPEPEGYRTDNYRAPVPATLAGARVLATEQAEAIWRSGSGVFTDGQPRAATPPNLPLGTIWRDIPRFNIPGSVWLPDTGYGTLAPATEDYFRNGLARASGGNKAMLLVIYCQADCWMSWNAAKRALSYGYSNVAWYPLGTDGWQRADLPWAASRCLRVTRSSPLMTDERCALSASNKPANKSLPRSALSADKLARNSVIAFCAWSSGVRLAANRGTRALTVASSFHLFAASSSGGPAHTAASEISGTLA